MPKLIVQTTQIVKRIYYLEVDDPTWAMDSIVMGDVDHFASTFLTEDIFSVSEVEEWPKQPRDTVNGATYSFDYGKHDWEPEVRWDLADENISK